MLGVGVKAWVCDVLARTTNNVGNVAPYVVCGFIQLGLFASCFENTTDPLTVPFP